MGWAKGTACMGSKPATTTLKATCLNQLIWTGQVGMGHGEGDQHIAPLSGKVVTPSWPWFPSVDVCPAWLPASNPVLPSPDSLQLQVEEKWEFYSHLEEKHTFCSFFHPRAPTQGAADDCTSLYKYPLSLTYSSWLPKVLVLSRHWKPQQTGRQAHLCHTFVPHVKAMKLWLHTIPATSCTVQCWQQNR